ncbi:hypothetical protein IQ266_14235 [filamentous cyanobacterium LEGE 11480]|uniref:Uncharacterized protein n=1 Tax=Romeriopsis navalis LEGE 11480 TaxID=2777977 RepID=A0A928VLR7_9CYAN|nr:hypothetical protein [Romeriopsis navalis]MBE9030891.1 hypothetical protein [Romeriopsis navalis LEGE 11480]
MMFRAGIYALIAMTGLFLFLKETLVSGLQNIPGDLGDAWLVNYFFEHSWQLISNPQYVGSLFSPAFFYPQVDMLALSENMFGTAPIYWLFRGFNQPATAFALWVIAICLLNFSAMVWTLRQWRIHPVLASFGGLLMAYSAQRAVRIGHAQLLPQFFTPIALWYLWQFFQKPTKRRFIILLSLSYWQILSGVYLGWFLLFGIGLSSLISLVIIPKLHTKLWQFGRQKWRFTIATMLIWAAGLVWLFTPYVKIKAIIGDRSYREVESMLPRLTSWVMAPPWENIWSPLFHKFSADLPMAHEHTIFLGTVLYVLTAWTAYVLIAKRSTWLSADRRQIVLICLSSASILFVLALYWPNGMSAWWFVYQVVPGASAIRVVTRIASLINIYLLIAGLITLDSCLAARKLPAAFKAMFLALLLILGTIEQSTSFQHRHITTPQRAQREITQLLRQDCQLAYYQFLPFTDLPPKTQTQITDQSSPVAFPRQYPGIPLTLRWSVAQLLMMWAGISANVPVVNGYSGSFPPGSPNFYTHWDVPKILQWLDNTPVNPKQPIAQIHTFCYITERLHNTPPSFTNNDWTTTSVQSENYVMQVFRRNSHRTNPANS